MDVVTFSTTIDGVELTPLNKYDMRPVATSL